MNTKPSAAPLRVAAFQRRPLFDDVAGTVERLIADLQWCEANAVHLAVFPECYLQGYASDRETIERLALSLDDRVFEQLLSTLARFKTEIVVGLIESRGQALFNTAVVVRDGVLRGTYAKTHPNENGFEAGRDYPVFETAGWTFGINICNDANFPDAALRVSQQGARLLCYPLNNMLLPDIANKWRRKSVENLQQRAIETGCWVVSSDVVGEQGDLGGAGHSTDRGVARGKISYGCTCIVRPDGQVVKQVLEGSEDWIVFDLT